MSDEHTIRADGEIHVGPIERGPGLARIEEALRHAYELKADEALIINGDGELQVVNDEAPDDFVIVRGKS